MKYLPIKNKVRGQAERKFTHWYFLEIYLFHHLFMCKSLSGQISNFLLAQKKIFANLFKADLRLKVSVDLYMHCFDRADTSTLTAGSTS